MDTKQLTSFMVMNVGSGTRVSYTYNKINGETGDLISSNVKENFFVLDEGLKSSIESIENYIRNNKF